MGKHNTPEKKRRQTQKIAALDGLRGVACLFVFHAHYAYSFSNCLEEAPTDHLRHRVMYQPFLSLLWSGVAMVDVFFFISGYVLVAKPLKLIRSNEPTKALSTISSAVFRRALRLYIPTMVMIIIIAIMAHFRIFEPGNVFYWQAHIGKVGPQEAPPQIFPTLFSQLQDAFLDCYRIFDNTIPWGPFNIPYAEADNARPSATIYDPHVWTIPVEFRCSMLIFMILVATAQLRASWRMTIHGGMALNCLFTERFPEMVFIAGMFFAEVDLIRGERQAKKEQDPSYGHRRSYSLSLTGTHDYSLLRRVMASSETLGHLFNLGLFNLGLFLLSVPSQDANVYDQYQGVLSWVPSYVEEKDDFIRVIGAVMTTWPVATSTLIAPLFSNSVAHYLGQISFALYLVHGSVIKSLWYWLQPTFTSMISGKPVWATPSPQFIRLWLVGYIIVLPVVLWSADIFWRVVDQRSITFARWVESKAT